MILHAGQCAVCRRAEEGVGYAPFETKRKISRVVWVCNHDIPLARVLYHMPSDIISKIETGAVEDGGNAAGQYLDMLGKTDLAELSQEEWQECLIIFLDAFGASMRDRLKAA